MAQGRPLGLLAAWLAVAEMVGTRAEHEALVAFLTYEERATRREEMLATDGGEDVAQWERTPPAGEGQEPEGQP